MTKSTKILSLVLSVIMLFGVFSASTPVFAADLAEAAEEKEYRDNLLTETVDAESEKAEIVCEVEEKRDEYSKTFKRKDGSYTTVISEMPLHTQKDGEWEEIDNTLQVSDEVLKNADGVYDIEFPGTISENEKITVTNDGESIAFSVNNIESAQGIVTVPETGGNDIAENGLSKAVSGITYESVDENTDVQYIVSPNSVKENIIVNDRDGIKDTYSFDIEKGSLTAVLDDSNALAFKNGENETVFTIPAPVMTDADNAVSYDIDVSVENAEKSVLTLIYTPSAEWLNSGDRVYPVVIDPVIVLPSERETVIEDTSVYWDSNDSESRNKNYADSPFGIVADISSADNSTYTKGNILVKFNMDVFAGFKAPGIVVTDVNYIGSGNAMGGNILAKSINGTWDSRTITYNDVYPADGSTPVITYEDEIIDYYTGVPQGTQSEEVSTVYFNITELFNQWLEGGRDNNGFALVPENPDASAMIITGGYLESANTGRKTYFDSYCSIDYVDVTANGDYEILSQQIGRGGTAEVNTFARSLFLRREDLSVNSLRMPVAIDFNYTPALDNYIDIYTAAYGEISGEDIVIDLPYGNNWVPSYLQMLHATDEEHYQVFTSEGSVALFGRKEETSEDGETVVTYEEDSSGASGYSLESTDSDELYLVTPNGEKVYFNDGGLAVRIEESEAGAEGISDSINITYSEDNMFAIDCVTDGVGRKYDFTYDGETGLLSEIACLSADGTQIKAGTTDADLKVTYGYDGNGNLTSVTHPDGETVTYIYDTNGNLVKVTNIDGYSIQYTYDNLGKVTKITEKSGDIQGNFITLENLENRQVKITDAYSGTEIQQFGKDGRLNYTFDEKGNYLKSEYAPSNSDVFSINGWKVAPENLLKNGSFEQSSTLNSARAKYWSSNFENTETENAYMGDSAYLISSDADVSKYIEQTVPVLNTGSYTLSAYVKSSVAGELTLKITAIDGNNSTETKDVKISSAEDWKHIGVTYTPESITPVKITASIGFDNSQGSYYVDCVQLESGYGTAEYNCIENGSFNNSDEYWSNATVVSDNINGKNVKAVKLNGGLPAYEQSGGTYTLNDSVSSVTQNVKINGKKGDIYSIGGWFKGLFDDNYINPDFIPPNADTNARLTNSAAQIKVTYSYTDTVNETLEDGTTASTQETVTENFAVNFAPHNKGWQYAEDSFVLKGDVESVDVTVMAQNIPYDSFATGIELSLDNNAFSLFESEGEESAEEVTPETEETPAVCPCENCEEIDCPCRCTSEALCTCVQCARRSNVEETSEDGKTVTTKTYDGNKYMQSAVHYSDDFNFITSEIDSDNISSSYAYNESGVLTSSADGSGVVTAYESNPVGYLTLAESDFTGLTNNAVNMAISYAYDGDLLTEVNQGDVQYTYEYDCWGQLAGVYVDGTKLVCYNYGDEENRTRIKSIVFGDGNTGEDFTVEYFYTDNNISSVKKYILVEDEEDYIIYNYEYDNLGNLTEIRDNGTGHRISYTETGLVISNINDNTVIYEIADVTPDSEENESASEESADAPVSITRETANGVSYDSNIYESQYDSATGKTTETEAVTGGKTIGTQTVSDWFGRNESSVVMTKNPVDSTSTDFASITSNYQYKTSGNTTTNLISCLNNTITGEETNTVNYSYTYDSNGRITGISTVSSVPNLSGASQYIYDGAGQLVREVTGSTTYEYAYDLKGNILSRKTYSNGTLTKTDAFTYGADSWEDRLTGYGNKTIAYDEIGNPTSYLGATLIWRGRELAGYEKGNKQISYSYDVDGMRYQKIVTTDGVETARYDYVYSDGKLILLTYTANGTSNTARFIYDSWGEPRGFILNNTAAYIYLKNAQGDITAIVDENGEVLLTYSYTAWGKVTYSATSMESLALAATLSNVNPFTYRGYCYDYDIGMYYLQSRYYDPEICRFINADSTDYLGATGTLLSYNLFAYCENEPVDFVDEKGYYSANKAIEYAKRWALIPNPKYIFARTGDCANFVSQCLYAGGIKTTSLWFPAYYAWGMGYNYYGMYCKVWQYYYSRAWSFVDGLFDYFSQKKYCYGCGFFGVRDGTEKYVVSAVKYVAEFVDVGDILFFTEDWGCSIKYHVVIISKVLKNDVNICGHTTNRRNYSLLELCKNSKKIKGLAVLKIRSSAV